jgi:hypothetical protein
MALTFSLVSLERVNQVVSFLTRAFGITKLPPNFSPEALNWKYFSPHPWWPTSRSYILEAEGRIAAHGCVAPVRFAAGERVLESMVIIDWASGKIAPGAGLLLFQRCMELQNSSLLAIGGSSDTVRILPRLRWFAPQADFHWYARPLKPWRRFLRSKRGLRDFLKFSRNLQWRLFPSLPAPGGWTCRPARADDPVFTPAGDFIPILRTRSWLDYLCACPVAKCRLWILEHEGVPRGHSLVADIGGSARVADFALAGLPAPEAATQAFSALVRALDADGGLVEIVAGSSLAQDASAFQACGLRHRQSAPVWLADPRKAFPQKSTLEIKPMLGDTFYLYDPSNPFQL